MSDTRMVKAAEMQLDFAEKRITEIEQAHISLIDLFHEQLCVRMQGETVAWSKCPKPPCKRATHLLFKADAGRPDAGSGETRAT